jgi:hypothetical protein
MAGAFILALALIVLGLIVGVALPGAGWILSVLLLIVAVVVLVRAFTGGRQAAPGP